MIVTLILVLALIALAPLIHFVVAMRIVGKETSGNRYYGRPLPQRQMIKRDLAERGRRLIPVLRLLSHLPLVLPTVRFRSMVTPRTATDTMSLRAAAAYVPDSRDVFVRRSGTAARTSSAH